MILIQLTYKLHLFLKNLSYFLLGGHNLAELDPVWFRQHIGVVNQEPVLFACSISDNISFGKEDATSDEIIEAAKQANAHDFITSFEVRSYAVVYSECII